MKSLDLLLAFILLTVAEKGYSCTDSTLIVPPVNEVTLEELIQLHAERIDETVMDGGPQRSPIYIPSVYLSDNTLFFERNCIGHQVEILHDEVAVFSTTITDEHGTVELPSVIIGECELRLYWGSIVFVGELILEQ